MTNKGKTLNKVKYGNYANLIRIKFNEILLDKTLLDRTTFNGGYRRQKKGVVYFVQCGDFDLYKIGMATTDLVTRVASIQTGCPFEINPIIACRTSKYVELEQELHNEFKDKRVIGEWFQLNKNEVDYITDKINKHG